MTDYEELLKECVEIAYQAGKRAIEYVKEHPLEIEEKPDQSFVTQVKKIKLKLKFQILG